MKRFLQTILEHVREFIEPTKKSPDIILKTNQLLHTILQAQKKHEAVHVIYLDKSFTGDIVKYDKENNKLILKNFQKNISAIISISDIKRLTLVPKTVRDSQKLS
ncbi:hypothetical protein ACVRWL_03865 [Streptococcus ratti]|uniref:YolD-like family protein n=2 Tax=Streptococcus ratti TaxID=1341 RepID=A0A7X9QG82_STRRT|nr:hypothetical protein [Streptococcus ratti]VEI59802.1 Uncharacterised protein [Streptococcus mutans]EJN93479.1 hypothetical protein SRA_03046 [Streptococcus ratti FA-1 = DSM 20564]EMP71774.1 hypothetical protein D822_00400 [Streptococcus ratti FA-1 = DSM 20564]NMD48429.1 hypothetical protein [Streptococcus ratti]QEY07356.1 hypothetical protein FY406_06775 [Streptococcus ratti]